VARNALLTLALLGTLGVAGCAGADADAQSRDADAQLAALRAHHDSLRLANAGHTTLAGTAASPDSAARPDSLRPDSARSDSAAADTVGLDAAAADSARRAREIEVMRETFAYGGGTRDPFASLLDVTLSGPEFANLELVGVYQDLRNPANSVIVLREKVALKRYKLRVGDQVGRARVVQIRPRDAVFTIHDFGFERQETLSLRKQEVETP
jgi:hypothetical protein